MLCSKPTSGPLTDLFEKARANIAKEQAEFGSMKLVYDEAIAAGFQIGDYVVHMDHGVGKFGGLVRVPQGDGYQEKIKIIYKNDDVVFVSTP